VAEEETIVKSLFAIAALTASSALAGDSLSTIGKEPNYGESPRNMVVELRLGPYYPDIDHAFTASPGPYASTFGNSPMLLGEAEIERQFFQKLGSLAAGVSAGYAEKYSHATADVGGAMTGEAVSLKIVPMKALAVYRFDWLNIKYGIPLVPFAKVGINVTYWFTTKGNQTPETVDNVPGQGWSYGITGMLGAAFLLDVLDPRLARDFDTGIGVNHSYIFAEHNVAWVNDFGRKGASGNPNALDLSSRFAMFGLAFEY
jgi:hypothetical protein